MREFIINMERIFQLVIWKVLISSGPLSCPIIWVTHGIIYEELIHGHLSPLTIVLQVLSIGCFGWSGRVLIRSCQESN